MSETGRGREDQKRGRGPTPADRLRLCSCLAPKALSPFPACGQRPRIFGQIEKLALKARLPSSLSGWGMEVLLCSRMAAINRAFSALPCNNPYAPWGVTPGLK